MRSLILGITIVMAVPAYVVGQQRDRAATGRTAVPRENAAPANQTDRRAEPSPRTPPREENSDDTLPSRAGRDIPNAARTGRLRDEHPQQGNPWLVLLPGQGRAPLPDQGNPWLVLLPGHGLASVPDRDRRRPGPRDGADQPRHGRPSRGANVVFVPSPIVVEREVVREATPVPVVVEQPLPARLILDIHPPTAQVFADGYYIGIPEDFRFEDGGAVLEPGPHRIDILARDHEPVSFDVALARGQTATFRHTLTPILQPVPDVVAPTKKQPATFYLIPGCYMGNVPPKDANLPATCDISRAVSVQY